MLKLSRTGSMKSACVCCLTHKERTPACDVHVQRPLPPPLTPLYWKLVTYQHCGHVCILYKADYVIVLQYQWEYLWILRVLLNTESICVYWKYLWMIAWPYMNPVLIGERHLTVTSLRGHQSLSRACLLTVCILYTGRSRLRTTWRHTR